MSKLILVKVKENLLHLSSYDKQMEDFVSTKPNRIIKVESWTKNGETFYKCPELDYWHFTEAMIIVPSDLNVKEKANLNITYMMNDGVCVFGKYNRKVFQGENGQFYIEKDEQNPEKGIEIFNGFFHKLGVL